jgi:hypothetical protein
VDTAQVILPKQATPWYVGSGGVDLSSYREKSISLLHGSLDGFSEVDDVQVWEVSF